MDSKDIVYKRRLFGLNFLGSSKEQKNLRRMIKKHSKSLRKVNPKIKCRPPASYYKLLEYLQK